MSQDNKFDKAFQERVKDLDFEFKEAHWDEMQALMDKRTKKRGALLWWISGVSVVSILLASSLFFTQDQATEVLANSTDATKTQPADASLTETTYSEPSQESTNKDALQAQRKDFSPQLESVEKSTESQSSKHNQEKNQPFQSSSQTSNTLNTTTPTQTNEPIVRVGESLNTPSTSNQRENRDIAKKSPKNQILSNDEFRALQPIVATSLDQDDMHLAEVSTESIQGRTWDSHVAILAGANYGQSFKTDEGKVGGLGSHWGLRFYFAHKKGFQLNTGLSFGVNSIRGLAYEETRKVFGFTQYDLVNTIEYNSMLTANIPIYMGYEGYKFSVAGGLRLNYIMNTRGLVHTWDNSLVDQNVWGYAHGIKYFNFACGIESTYRIARRWDLGINLDIDLSSRSEESNDLISPEARLWQAGFFIKYRLN